MLKAILKNVKKCFLDLVLTRPEDRNSILMSRLLYSKYRRQSSREISLLLKHFYRKVSREKKNERFRSSRENSNDTTRRLSPTTLKIGEKQKNYCRVLKLLLDLLIGGSKGKIGRLLIFGHMSLKY